MGLATNDSCGLFTITIIIIEYTIIVIAIVAVIMVVNHILCNE